MPDLSNKATVSTLVASSLKELFGSVKTFVGCETLIRIYGNYEIDTSIGVSMQAAYYAVGFALYAFIASAVCHVQLNRIHQNVHGRPDDDVAAVPAQVDDAAHSSQNTILKNCLQRMVKAYDWLGSETEALLASFITGLERVITTIADRIPLPKWMVRKLIQPLLGLGDLLGHAGEVLGFFIFLLDIALKKVASHTWLLVITVFFHIIALLLARFDLLICWRAMQAINRREDSLLLPETEALPLLPTTYSGEASLWTKIALPVKELFGAVGVLVTYAIVYSTLHARFGADTPLQVSVGSLILSALTVPGIFVSNLCCHYYLNKRSEKFNEQQTSINAEDTPLVAGARQSFFSKHFLSWRHGIYEWDRWGHTAEVMDACIYLVYLGLKDQIPDAAFIPLMLLFLWLSFKLAGPDNTTCKHNMEEMIEEEARAPAHALRQV